MWARSWGASAPCPPSPHISQLLPRLSIDAGELQRVPTWHSILLCMMLAPLGVLSHAVTRAVTLRRS